MASALEESESESDSSDELTKNVVVTRKIQERARPSVRDASVKMWGFGVIP